MDEARERRFIDECHAWNPWWEEDFEKLERTSKLHPRSDLYTLLPTIDHAVAEPETGTRLIGCVGQTGIGKTTLLNHLLATVIDIPELGFEVQRREYEIVDSYDPVDVLYLPLEQSLYNLERPEDALDIIRRIAQYHRTRLAANPDEVLLLVDDLGAVDADPEAVGELLLELVGARTQIVYTARIDDQIDFGTAESEWGRTQVPLLPIKFIDFAQSQSETDQARELETLQAGESTEARDDPEKLTIQDIRRPLQGDPDPEAFAENLERLCFDILTAEQRRTIANHAREYFRQGGFPRQFTFGKTSPLADETTNELFRSNLELFLYKELAAARSIERPANLLQLCGLAATPETNEYGYRELAERLGVDRRTVQDYLRALEDVIALTESRNYALQRHRKTRLYLREPRHVVVLSQRHAHEGFESLGGRYPYNPTFERVLCKTVLFDHAMRLNYNSGLTPEIEFAETEAGDVEYILRKDTTVLPMVLDYEPRPGSAVEAATAFDPSTGTHEAVDGEYRAPVRFVLTDGLPADQREAQSLLTERDGITICHVPVWAFLLVC